MSLFKPQVQDFFKNENKKGSTSWTLETIYPKPMPNRMNFWKPLNLPNLGKFQNCKKMMINTMEFKFQPLWFPFSIYPS
jgi:hypothetical protein